MWGIVPAAGMGTRIQPLAFSKELLPVGSRIDAGVERPKAVSEYLVERMVRGGADKLCFVIAPGKADIVGYFGGRAGEASIAYAVQPRAAGLCDALFRPLPFIAPDEPVLVGLPDTIWFPEDGFRMLTDGALNMLLFPVANPEVFDAVLTEGDRVREIQVKRPNPDSFWIWGAFRTSGRVLATLERLWLARDRRDEYLGTLLNAYIAAGGDVRATRAGEAYVDVGTFDGYRLALDLLRSRQQAIRRHAPDR